MPPHGRVMNVDEQRKDTSEDSGYSGMFARHEPQNFTGTDADAIEALLASPPDRPDPLPEGLLRWAPGTLGGA